MDINLSGLFTGLIVMGLICGLIIMGIIWGIFGWVRNPSVLKSEQPIQPKIELIIKDNQIDTLYVYRKPNKKEDNNE